MRSHPAREHAEYSTSLIVYLNRHSNALHRVVMPPLSSSFYQTAPIVVGALLLVLYFNKEIRGVLMKVTELSIWKLKVAFDKNASGSDGGDVAKVYAKSAEFFNELPGFMERATAAVEFTGIHFNSTLSDRESSYRNALKSGKSVTLVALDPAADSLPLVAAGLGVSRDVLFSECQSFLLKAVEMEAWAKAEKCPGVFSVRLYSRLPRMRTYLFDNGAGELPVAFVPLLEGVKSSESPAYLIKPRSETAKKIVTSIEAYRSASKPVVLQRVDALAALKMLTPTAK